MASLRKRMKKVVKEILKDFKPSYSMGHKGVSKKKSSVVGNCYTVKSYRRSTKGHKGACK